MLGHERGALLERRKEGSRGDGKRGGVVRELSLGRRIVSLVSRVRKSYVG
jgi:hypothetical protein